MRKNDLVYFAGLFDGEGCISLVSRPNTKRQPRYFQLRVMFTNTNSWACQSFKFAFGGYITLRHFENKRWKDAYNWVATGNIALAFLKVITPHLRLKRAEAELAVKFQEERNRRGNRGAQGLTEAEKILEETQYKLMRGMKTKQTDDK